MLIVTGLLFVAIGFIMHTLRKAAARQHRKMVAMSWSQIAEMRRKQGSIRRRYFGRLPSPRGGTLLMFLGLGLSGFGVLVLIGGY
jgi:hypothetical protein